MSLAEFPTPVPSAVRRFVDAVVALSDNPRPDNVLRYLVASRALEDRSPEEKAAPERRGLTKGLT